MADERVDRRLAAILAADIAGYSALMGADEAQTVRDLKGHRLTRAAMRGAEDEIAVGIGGRQRAVRQLFGLDKSRRMRSAHGRRVARAG